MAKTIMISNDVYKEMKLKKANRSFSELITELLHPKEKPKGRDLQSCLGLLKSDDKEYDAIEPALRRSWRKWSKKYV